MIVTRLSFEDGSHSAFIGLFICARNLHCIWGSTAGFKAPAPSVTSSGCFSPFSPENSFAFNTKRKCVFVSTVVLTWANLPFELREVFERLRRRRPLLRRQTCWIRLETPVWERQSTQKRGCAQIKRMINRFFKGKKKTNSELLKKYIPPDDPTTSERSSARLFDPSARMKGRHLQLNPSKTEVLATSAHQLQ